MKKLSISMDLWLLGATMALVGIGVVMVYSASFAVAGEKFGGGSFFIFRHLARLGLGLVGFFIAVNLDYHKWASFDKILLGIGLLCLALLIVNPNVGEINGARRWIRVGGFSFQPSELMKLVLILFMARSLGTHQHELSDFRKGLLPHLALVGVSAGLIALEPNFSTAMLITLILMTMIFLAGARLHHLVGITLALIPLAYVVMLQAPYRRARVMAFLDPGTHVKSLGYQAHQAIVGLGAGGFFGSGLGESRQKLFYLPEPYTDFVFAVLGEELGFLGGLLVIGLFLVIGWRGLRIALRAPDQYGYLLAAGITTMLTIYAFFHIGVVTSLLPTTGIPMPFVSYGGMSLVFTMTAMGILLNISGQGRDRESLLRGQK